MKCFRYYAGWADKITGKTISSGKYFVLRSCANGTVFLGSFSFKLTSNKLVLKYDFTKLWDPLFSNAIIMYLAS